MSDAKRTAKIVARLIGGLSLSSALVLLALGGSCYGRAVRFKKTAAEAQGTVIELRADSGNHGTTFYPIIKFADQTGHGHTLYSSTGSYPPAYEVGERVSVLYDPANPKDARINSFVGLWLWPLILAVMGGLDVLTGLFLFFGVPLIIAWAERRAAERPPQQAAKEPP